LLDVNGVVESALSLVGQQLLSHEIDVRTELAVGLPEVLGESNALEQVLLNLLGNARDALDDVSEDRVLEIRTSLTDLAGEPAVAIDVSDSAKGIPEAIREKLFEPFFTTKEVGKGTGLGLSISYGIVEEHGGRLEATNRPEGGARFRVILPIARPA
jgi:histidine kinase